MNKFMMIILMTAFVLNFGCGSDPQIIAHRGYSAVAPENTLSAVEKAWMANADAVEIDIHLTSDKSIVVIHDYDTKRTAGESFVVKNTNSEQLRKLDVGSFMSDEFKGEKIPYLNEVLKTIPENKQLFIEIKCDATVIPVLKDVIEKSGYISKVCFIAFNADVLAAAKKEMPQVPVYWLLGSRKSEQTGELLPYDDGLIVLAKSKGFDGLNVNFHSLTKQFVNNVHKEDIRLFVWTVNDMEVVKIMVEMGVDGITTDYPYDAMKQIKNVR